MYINIIWIFNMIHSNNYFKLPSSCPKIPIAPVSSSPPLSNQCWIKFHIICVACAVDRLFTKQKLNRVGGIKCLFSDVRAKSFKSKCLTEITTTHTMYTFICIYTSVYILYNDCTSDVLLNAAAVKAIILHFSHVRIT